MSWLQSVNFQSVQPCASEHMFHQICFSSHTRYIWIFKVIWYMLCMEGLLLEDFSFGCIQIWPPHFIHFSFIPSIRIFPTFPMLQQQLRVAKAWCYVILKRCTTFGSLDRPGQRPACWPVAWNCHFCWDPAEVWNVLAELAGQESHINIFSNATNPLLFEGI